MAQLQRTIQGSSESPETLKTHAPAPTIEQTMKGERAFRIVDEDHRPANTSPISSRVEEMVDSPNSKKTVLTKVKEKAKKLKNSLSGRKRYDDPNDPNYNSPHSWDTNLHDNDEEYEHDEAEVDPEYLGAPMYESEAAPENLKETARQHPRADPVVSEKHMCPRMNPTTTEIVSDKCVSPNKTLTESVSEKLAPAYSAVSDATHSIASKFTGLGVTTAPQNLDSSGMNKRSSTDEISREGFPGKGYSTNKLESEDDEKAIAQALTEAMSPKRSSNNSGEGGVVEKVKEAVTSIFRHDEPADSRAKSVNSSSDNTVSWSSSAPYSLQNRDASRNAYPSSAVYGASANVSRHVPASTNAHEVVEEENVGRRLQAN